VYFSKGEGVGRGIGRRELERGLEKYWTRKEEVESLLDGE
jgi:hypothetical protein